MSASPAVSVVMPVHNAEQYLDKAIDSVIAQTYSDFELICFNDASTDGSLDILTRRACADSRIRVIDSNINVRQGAGRNAGIRAARGSFIIFLDADDALRSDTIERCMSAAAEGADLVSYCYANWHEKAGSLTPVKLLGDDAPGVTTDELRRRYILRTTSICCSMYSRDLFIDNGLWFPQGVFYEDNAVALALQLSATHPKYINESFYLYRQDNMSVTRSLNNPRFFDRIGSALTLLGHLKRLRLYDKYREEIDFMLINQYLVHTVFGAIYRFDKVQTNYIKEVKAGIKQIVPEWRRNNYWLRQPLSKRLKYNIHATMPRVIKALSKIKQRF